MRTAPVLLCLALLGGCNQPQPGLMDSRGGEAETGQVACALDGATAFTASCTMQRFTGSQQQTLVIGRGDSGFRRFELTRDGRGLVTADGAEQARVTIVDDAEVEIRVGDDRYRLPAAISGSALPPGNETTADQPATDDPDAGR